jgi:hypothetical protein
MSFNALCSSRVRIWSARLGCPQSEGWLWASMTAAQLQARALRTTSLVKEHALISDDYAVAEIDR